MTQPWRTLEPLQADEWESVRVSMMFDCCKWDMQSEDHSVLADFPLVLEEDAWELLAKQAEQLASEALTAELELLQRPEMHVRLGLPRSVRKALGHCGPSHAPIGCARVMRFDFHLTTEGWRISEVNSDVPGGFIEASGFADLMAEHYPGYAVPPNPAIAYTDALAAAAGEGAIGLVHATTHSDDAQVMHYFAQKLLDKGLRPFVVGPNHLNGNVALRESLARLPRRRRPCWCGSFLRNGCRTCARRQPGIHGFAAEKRR